MIKRVMPLVAALAWVGCGDDGVGAPDYYRGSTGDAGVGSYADTGSAAPSYPADTGPSGMTPDASSSDRFEPVGTNPFVMVDHDPFSTFAADVDTASYDIFVRDIEDGVLPDPASVRLEEYVNYFDYAYDAPDIDAEIPFAIQLSASEHAMGRDIAQLRVGIQAASPPDFVQLQSNIVFLVDVSGSMATYDKLPLAKTLMLASLEVLTPLDTVSIVTYSGTVGVALPPTPADEYATISTAINALRAYGSTAGGDAINLAYDQAEAGFIEGGFNHVVMMTDGDFNIGITDTDALVGLIEEKRASGVTLTALGFGSGDLNDAMMERVSNAGNGTYSVITSESHARDYGRHDLLAGIHLVAQDMKIQVEFNPDFVIAYRLLGYENRAIADSDFRVDSVDAGEVGAGHRVTALYELVLKGQDIPSIGGAPAPLDGDRVTGTAEIGTSELVQVRVRWKDLGASATDPAHETRAALAPADVGQLSAADDDHRWAAAIAAFSEILKESPYARNEDLATIDTLTAETAGTDEARLRFRDLFGRARTMLGY